MTIEITSAEVLGCLDEPRLPPIVVDGVRHAGLRATQIAAAWPDRVAEVMALVSDAEMATRADGVVSERKRRLALGFDYDFGDARGVVHVGTTEADMAGWSEVTTLSNALIAIGRGDEAGTITIVPEGQPVQITALEWQRILLAGAGARQVIWAKSFALQGRNPIPQDYDADTHWA